MIDPAGKQNTGEEAKCIGVEEIKGNTLKRGGVETGGRSLVAGRSTQQQHLRAVEGAHARRLQFRQRQCTKKSEYDRGKRAPSSS